jgi:hypothetical protein
MPLPKFISNIIGGKTSDLIGSIGGVIDNLSQSKEEKEQAKLELTKAINEHYQKMEAELTSQMEIQSKENESARKREIEIATSEKVPLLTKIVVPILALFVVGATFTIWALILFRNYAPKVNEAMIIGSLTTMCAAIISYYFGSSLSSNNKSKTIDNFINK